jgi:hypothetical protein
MAFLGMRGNGDWATDQRPKSWRETMLYLYPNGDMPLTAILSMMGSEKVTDPEFNWWEKSLPSQSGAVSSIWLTPDLSTTEYTTGGAVGDVVYAACTAAVMAEFRVGHEVLLRNTANYLDDTVAKVVGTLSNGASSYIACKLLQADPTTTGLADCNRILVIGNISAEGDSMPDAIAYDPTKRTNYTQIFRTPLSITRTARLTRLRTGDQYKEAKREALELHGIEMEKAFIWGYGLESTGSNGKPERTTWGLIPYLVANSGINDDFTSNTDFTDTSWLSSGEEWLDSQLEEMFRYGSDERLAFCGSGVILGINKLIKEYGNFEFNAQTKDYGINVITWTTPFGVIHMKRHPLFSYEVTNRNSMVCFEPKNLKYRFITDTTFYDDPDKKNTGRNRIDGTDEEYLTECGLEFHHASTCAFLNGFNSDNGTP